MRDFTGVSIGKEPRSVLVVKRDIAVSVTFAVEPGELQTLEGVVRYLRGDALVTGRRGERWPIRRETFLRTYAALAGAEGADGEYHKISLPVWALRLEEDARVAVPGGELSGRPGDWLVQYGQGEYGIVAADIFAATYISADYASSSSRKR